MFPYNTIVFHVNVPPCLVFAFDWLQASISSLAISLRYQAAVFPLPYASSIVLDNSFRKHSAIIFQYIYIFSNLIMVVRQNLVSVYIQRNPVLRPPLLYDHLLSHLLLSFDTDVKSPSHFIILKNSLMRPPRYLIRPGFSGPTLVASTGFYSYFLIFVFHIIEQKTKKCASAGLWQLM